MISQIVLFCSLLVALTIPAKAGRFEEIMKCDGKSLIHNEKMKIAVETCANKLVPDTSTQAPKDDAEKQKQLMTRWKAIYKHKCFYACQLQEMGVIKDNKFEVEVFKTTMADTIYPEELRPKLKTAVEACAKNTETLTMDEECKSYHKLQECMGVAHLGVCKVDLSKFESAFKTE